MALEVDHSHARETQDRSHTFTLLDEIRSASSTAVARDVAFHTLAFLEDYRSIGPLTAMVDDDQLSDSVREAASEVLQELDDSTTTERRRGWWDSGDPVTMAHALRLMTRSEADIVAVVACDDEHPLQALALYAMTFGFDETEYSPLKIRALGHPNPEVRVAAAEILLWDEPVGAEGPLLAAGHDPSSEVATAAVDTLQYYPSRRVLRALADFASAGDDRVRAAAAKSFESVQDDFECFVRSGQPEQVALLRDWMKPVADLIRWPDTIQNRQASSSPELRRRVAVSEDEVLALVLDPDGEWAPPMHLPSRRGSAWPVWSERTQGSACERRRSRV